MADPLSTPLSALFDRGAAVYDASRRQLVSGFDAFYATAVEVAGHRGRCRTVLAVFGGWRR